MKSLEQFVSEKYEDEYGNVILTKEDITLDVLKDAVYSGSFMNDRAVIIMSDSGSWVKIKKDGWQYQSTVASALGSTISSEELWKKVQKADNIKMYER